MGIFFFILALIAIPVLWPYGERLLKFLRKALGNRLTETDERPYRAATVFVVCSDEERSDRLTDALLDGLANAGSTDPHTVSFNRLAGAADFCRKFRCTAVVIDHEFASAPEADIIQQLNPTIIL